jgi:hypothetical protein
MPKPPPSVVGSLPLLVAPFSPLLRQAREIMLAFAEASQSASRSG